MQLLSLFAAWPVVGLAVVLTFLLSAGSGVALWYWADREATARGDGASTMWTFAYLLTVVGMVYYVFVRYVRGDIGAREAPPAKRERLATAYVLAVLGAFLVGAVATPPDPFTQALAFPPLFVAAFVLTYLLVYRDGIDRIRGRGSRGPDG